MNNLIGRSFKTTNIIESLNSQVDKHLRKVKYWKNSNMRYRWIAAALMEAEMKMRKISNYKHLPELRKKIKSYIADTPGKSSRISTKVGT